MKLLHRPRFLRGERMDQPYAPYFIETPRLYLGRHVDTPEARKAWHALGREPSVVKYMAWPQRDELESALHLRERTKHTTLLQKDDFIALRVVLPETLLPIGDVSAHLRTVDPDSRRVELGWVFHPVYGGQGFATEAVHAFIDDLRENGGVKIVEAIIHPENQSSRRLAERLGMKHEGYDLMNGHVIYTMLL